MDDNKKKKILNDMNTEDFNTMRSMLSEIELKIMQLDPLLQRQFYHPIQMIIFESWDDATDPENKWLYKDGARILLTDEYFVVNGFDNITDELWSFEGYRVKISVDENGERFYFCINSKRKVKYADELLQ